MWTHRANGSVGCGWSGNAQIDIPGQQFVDAVDRMVGDPLQHVLQVGLRIQAVQLRRSDQRVHPIWQLSAIWRWLSPRPASLRTALILCMDILCCGNRNPPPLEWSPVGRRIAQRRRSPRCQRTVLTHAETDRQRIGTVIAITLEW